jgi:hypothetical protein
MYSIQMLQKYGKINNVDFFLWIKIFNLNLKYVHNDEI